MENEQIQEIVNRETNAWDKQDVEQLLSIFHPDMVWPWPPDDKTHDPVLWVIPMGRFDMDRWRNSWLELFNTHRLIHNKREIIKIEISNEGDGAFAVVDIDTLWIHLKTAERNHWVGRTCKGYTRVDGEWKMIMQTGALNYSQ